MDRLREELLGVPGVADAEFAAEGGGLSDVRIRLDAGADADAVGAQVQRLLARRGVSARLPANAPRLEAVPESAGVSPATTGPEAARPTLGVADDRGGGVLAAVAVEESADSVVVTAVADDGRRFSRRAAAADEEAVAAAVVAAVGALVVGRPQRLLQVSTAQVAGSRVVTVVVAREDGRPVAGASVVAASVAHAVARATEAALRS